MDKILAVSLALPILIFSFVSAAKGQETKGKKILAIIASSDFRDEELLIPKGILEKEGFKVVVASSSLEISRGMLGAEIRPDILIDNVNVDDYAAVIFVGGAGASEYWGDPAAHNIARDALEKDKIIAAICIAPVTLANAGLLSGKRATVWPSESKKLLKKRAFYTGSPVEVDGNIITANGPDAASQFAQEILKKLK